MPGTMSGGRTTKIKKIQTLLMGKSLIYEGKWERSVRYDEQGILIQLC